MITMLLNREEPFKVWLDWMISGGTIYGLVAHTREGKPVALTEDEHLDALELAYSHEPEPHWHEIY